MKKRILATFLCAVMSLSLLAGCGGSSSADTNDSSDGDSSAPTGETYTMKMHLSIGETDLSISLLNSLRIPFMKNPTVRSPLSCIPALLWATPPTAWKV